MVSDDVEKSEKKPTRVLIVDGGLSMSFHRALAQALAERNIDVLTAHEAQMLVREPELPVIEMLREFETRNLVRAKAYNRSTPYHQQKQSNYRRQHRGRR